MKIVLLSLAIMVHLGKKRPPQGKKSSSRSSVSCDPFVHNEVLFTPTTSACCCLCPKEHLFRQVSKSFLPRLALFQRKHVLQRSPKCRVDQMATKQNMLGQRCTQSAVETSGAEQLFLLQSVLPQFVCKTSVCVPLLQDCCFVPLLQASHQPARLPGDFFTWQLLAGTVVNRA